jgi:lipoyl-dependent peroxiredoxin
MIGFKCGHGVASSSKHFVSELEERQMPTRSASAQWEGGLKGGRGSYKGANGLAGQYNFSSRFEEGPGSNPEELLAAAEAACYSMALSAGLEKNGTPPSRVETTAHCTVEKTDAGFSITRMKLDVRAKVPGLDAPTFQRLANEARDGCPVSRALRGNVDIQVAATLGA